LLPRGAVRAGRAARRTLSSTSTVIEETADAIVARGLRRAGYEYVNIDDCWQGVRP
jgi:hypothetical protein